METIAERLKRARKKQGLGVFDLSLMIGVASSTINAWENGKRNPSPANLRKLATALKVSAFELQYGDQASAMAKAVDQARKLVAEAAGVPIDRVVIKIKR